MPSWQKEWSEHIGKKKAYLLRKKRKAIGKKAGRTKGKRQN